MTLPLPTFADIEDARKRLAGNAVQTPVLESHHLNEITRGRILIKAESLQRTGSFKFRGAWNRISRLDRTTAKGGVVAYSSGNHAQGVAAAAQLRGLPALIVMPADTPEIKKANTRGYGAEIVTYDRATEAREEIAARLAAERQAIIVPPFEDPYIIAGQGTVGLEIVVFLRSADEVRAVADHEPFAPELVAASMGKLQVLLLPEKPAAAAREEVLSLASDDDRLSFGVCELYWLPSGGTLESTLDRARIEKLIGPTSSRTKGTMEELARKFF